MYFRRKTSSGRAYLQIVESRRDGDQVRQQVIATLGRFEELQASGQLERLTFFSDYPSYKASNGVISDDGRYLAFQMARSVEQAGVGHGIFIYDLNKATSGKR